MKKSQNHQIDATIASTTAAAAQGGASLEFLRQHVKDSLQNGLLGNAAFFATKLVSFSSGAAAAAAAAANTNTYTGSSAGSNIAVMNDSLKHRLKNEASNDVFLLAKCWYMNGEYSRASLLLERSGLLQYMATPSSLSNQLQEDDENQLMYIHLACQCHMASSQPDVVLSLLSRVLSDKDTFLQLRERARSITKNKTEFSLNILSSLCLILGQAHQLLENRPRASQWFKAALYCDIRCVEAFTCLIDFQLKPVDESQLLNDLTKAGAFLHPECAWLYPVYQSMLLKHDHNHTPAERFQGIESFPAFEASGNIVLSSSPSSPEQKILSTLKYDPDTLAALALSRYSMHDTQGALRITTAMLQGSSFHHPYEATTTNSQNIAQNELLPPHLFDPFQRSAMLTHIACLVEIGDTSDLFYLGHRLVDTQPKSALSWYAVGCYYYAAKKLDAARRYFHKATMMDPSFAHAWIACGHAFALHDESDQAISAYRSATRIYAGSHLPVLATAMEYLRANNVPLAEQFALHTHEMCTSDPLVYNELGVVNYRLGRYNEAAAYFHGALQLAFRQPHHHVMIGRVWEPTIYNLAQTLRKQGKYVEAVTEFERALLYAPKNPSTHASLGLTHHLMGKISKAIACYHAALSLRSDDTITFELLSRALEKDASTPILSRTAEVLGRSHSRANSSSSARQLSY